MFLTHITKKEFESKILKNIYEQHQNQPFKDSNKLQGFVFLLKFLLDIILMRQSRGENNFPYFSFDHSLSPLFLEVCYV